MEFPTSLMKPIKIVGGGERAARESDRGGSVVEDPWKTDLMTDGRSLHSSY